MDLDEQRVRSAWEGRISGCQLGKPLEVLSIAGGRDAVKSYLRDAEALPLRDYVPALPGTLPDELMRGSCREQITRSEPDDDINYTVLALLVLEACGATFTTEDVARAWIRYLPVGGTFTAERETLGHLARRAPEFFGFGEPAGFDVSDCASAAYGEWIGAQIRADLYGWVCPGHPSLAAELARRDAALSHRGDGIEGAAFVAALGAAIPGCASLHDAVDQALAEVAVDSGVAAAVHLGRTLVGAPDAGDRIAAQYPDLPWAHTLNNLAVVVWGLLSEPDDFAAAVGETVAAGFDTDCNGATVGGLWGLSGRRIPDAFTAPWRGRVAVTLAGMDELSLDDLVLRTCRVGRRIDAVGT